MAVNSDTTNCKAVILPVLCLTIIVVVIAALVGTNVLISKMNNSITQPQEVAVTAANLTRFELATSPASSLFYNLTFTMSIQNSDSEGDAYYDNMQIDCYHNGEQFDLVDVPGFSIKQGWRLLLNFSTSGDSTVNLEGGGIDALGGSKEGRFLDMEIWLKGKRIFLDDYYEGDVLNLSYKCKLRLPLYTPRTNSTHHEFKPVKCLDGTSYS